MQAFSSCGGVGGLISSCDIIAVVSLLVWSMGSGARRLQYSLLTGLVAAQYEEPWFLGPGIEPAPSAVEAGILNHWPAGKPLCFISET